MTRSGGKRSGGEGWSLTTVCARCQGEPARCVCESPRPPRPGGTGAVVRLRLERRRGKAVTVAEVAGLPAEAVRDLGRELRALCGTGGTSGPETVELQGDHRERIRERLGARGLTVKG